MNDGGSIILNGPVASVKDTPAFGVYDIGHRKGRGSTILYREVGLESRFPRPQDRLTTRIW
jgi:hypothetical protein